jgi:hypothetical protein
MLGDTSEFGPLDLLGALTLNAVTTNMACKESEFRVGFKVAGKDGGPKAVRAITDYRFLGGLAAAAVGQFAGGETTRRAGHDIAVGLLGSFVSTETCRTHALKRITSGAAPAPGQISQDQSIPDSADAAAATEGGGNYYGYGW